MTRLEVLQELKKYVEEDKNIKLFYFKDGCYCAVGYIAHLCNIPDDVLINWGSTIVTGVQSNMLPFDYYTLYALQSLNDYGTRDNLLQYIEELISREMPRLQQA